ncbi:hypothetical protein BVC80_8511g3 [Macleaya cordata]|uniref:Uncharacterized protein n=1 Tax=Macleaya cordata TaxID=56857 RepID=A0A200QDV7_MACCD|nr:hypothetical protein BVC80_8511g3 [Macleaya cordata]
MAFNLDDYSLPTLTYSQAMMSDSTSSPRSVTQPSPYSSDDLVNDLFEEEEEEEEEDSQSLHHRATDLRLPRRMTYNLDDYSLPYLTYSQVMMMSDSTSSPRSVTPPSPYSFAASSSDLVSDSFEEEDSQSLHATDLRFPRRMTFNLDNYNLPRLTYSQIMMSDSISSATQNPSPAASADLVTSHSLNSSDLPAHSLQTPMSVPKGVTFNLDNYNLPRLTYSQIMSSYEASLNPSPATSSASTTSIFNDSSRSKRVKISQDKGSSNTVAAQSEAPFIPQLLMDEETPIQLTSSGLESLEDGKHLPRNLLQYANLPTRDLHANIASNFYTLQRGISEMKRRYHQLENKMEYELQEQRALVEDLRLQLEAERNEKAQISMIAS